MAGWLMAPLILLLLGGIILLGGKSPLKKQTREEYIQELAEFLEGTLEPIEEEIHGNSFRIRFMFEGQACVYEDTQQKGFKDKVHKAYVKVKTTSPLTLTFTEKPRSTTIRSDIFLASEISTQEVAQKVSLHIPEHLKDIKIFTSDVEKANMLLKDKKASLVFKQFKNIDTRGYPFLSIAIIEGTVILEFYEVKIFKPSLYALKADIASIEDNLERLMVIVRKLNEGARC